MKAFAALAQAATAPNALDSKIDRAGAENILAMVAPPGAGRNLDHYIPGRLPPLYWSDAS
jgi:hypothetical protein